MPSKRTAIPLGTAAGSLIGSTVGALTGTCFSSEAQAFLGSVGATLGGVGIEVVKKTDYWKSYQRKCLSAQAIGIKQKSDRKNFVVSSPERVMNCLKTSRDLFLRSGLISEKQLRLSNERVIYSIDYRSDLSIEYHAASIRKVSDTLSISCPPLFYGLLASLRLLKKDLAKHGVSLMIDESTLTSKQQVCSINHDPKFDFVVGADAAFYLGHQTKNLRKYKRICPLTSQTDCLIGTTNEEPSSQRIKIHYHSESTAELAIRSSGLWSSNGSFSEIASANSIVAIAANLERGEWVTTWNPITDILLRTFSDLTVIPCTRFRGLVSLFGKSQWKKKNARSTSAQASFISLISRYVRKRSVLSTMFPMHPAESYDAFDSLCGCEELC